MEKKKPGIVGALSIVFAVLNAIGLLVSVGCSLHIRHKFMQVYEDLEIELPGIAQLILNTHWAIWILTALVLLSILAVKELLSKKWVPLLLNGIFVLFGIVYWAVFSTAMVIPLMTLIQQLGNG